MIGRTLIRYFPGIKHELRIAHMNVRAEDFLQKTFMRAAMASLLLGLLFAMLADKQGMSFLMIPLGFIVVFLVAFYLGIKRPRIAAHRRAVDIDREVLFAGRFILIKLHSGKPLINALTEAAHSYGVASKYFGEIVHDIELGTSLEDAIERAMTYTSSESFRKILFQIHNALKLGTDVTQSLEAVLQDITNNQLLEIQRYGKKLPSLTLFYMIVAIVFPSLGMTIFTVLASFTNITMNLGAYALVLFFLVILNFVFISLFKTIRPKVNI